jgi:hypothetical protein
MRTRREFTLFTQVLRQKLKKLFLVLTNQLSQLWVAGSDLLQDGFEHLRLLLHQLSQLLEMRVVAKEIEIAQGTSIPSTSSTCCSATCSTTSLCCCFEKIYWLLASGFRRSCGGSDSRCNGCWRRGGSGASLSLFLLVIFWDTLSYIS